MNHNETLTWSFFDTSAMLSSPSPRFNTSLMFCGDGAELGSSTAHRRQQQTYTFHLSPYTHLLHDIVYIIQVLAQPPSV